MKNAIAAKMRKLVYDIEFWTELRRRVGNLVRGKIGGALPVPEICFGQSEQRSRKTCMIMITAMFHAIVLLKI